jgi:hypothetical protein
MHTTTDAALSTEISGRPPVAASGSGRQARLSLKPRTDFSSIRAEVGAADR